MQLQPYIFLEGRCEEALEFYQQAIDAQVTYMLRFNESPDKEQCGDMPGDKIMHSSVRVGDAEFMATDGMCQSPPSFQGFALALSVEDEAKVERYFNALAEGGEVQMPLGKTFWSPKFGMLKDRFGVSWMINLVTEGQ